LRILPSGPAPSHPGELLSPDRTGPLFKELVKAADFVIIDSPPVLLVADAISMAPQVDAVVLVAREGTSTRKEVELARATFERAGTRVIGTVFTNHQGIDSEYYSYLAGERLSPRSRWFSRWIAKLGQAWRQRTHPEEPRSN
jgi:Mrp family chromosome partitioning ATPase